MPYRAVVAAWELTEDVAPIVRRTRKLTLDELIAGALILYPIYMSHTRDVQISPEEAIDELIEWRIRIGGGVVWWRSLFRMVLCRLVGVK